MAIGQSFAPGADMQMDPRNGGRSGGSRLSPQQAVKILSLRVPETLPSNAPVNRALLTAPGGRAAGASGLNSMIQQLMQLYKPMAGTAGPMPSGAPMQGPQGQGPSAAPPLTAPSAPQQAPPFEFGRSVDSAADFGGFNPWDLLLNQDLNLDPAERQRRLNEASQFFYATPAKPKPVAPRTAPNVEFVDNFQPPAGGRNA